MGFDFNNVSGAVTFDEVTAPATPPTGSVRLYAKASGFLYSKDDAGAETQLGGGGGGAAEDDNQIVYGSGGGTSVDSDPDFTYVPTTGRFRVNTTDDTNVSVTSSTPGALSLFATGASIASNANGASIYILAGHGDGTGNGGNIDLETGWSVSTSGSNGGSMGLSVSGGAPDTPAVDTAAAGGTPGSFQLLIANSGDATSNSASVVANATVVEGGDITITAGSTGVAVVTGTLGDGNAVAGDGGNVIITAGDGGDATSGDGTGNATSGGGGSVRIVAGDKGLATVNGVGTATTGRPGDIEQVTLGGYWVQSAGYFDYERETAALTFVLYGETINSTPTELFLNGSNTPSRRMLLPSGTTNNMTWTFEIRVVARNQSAAEAAGYVIEGVIDYDGSNVAFIGTPQKTVLGESDSTWDANVTADNTYKSLALTVTGDSTDTVRWAATARIISVGDITTPE